MGQTILQSETLYLNKENRQERVVRWCAGVCVNVGIRERKNKRERKDRI